jgi:hypothetical protein
MAVLVTDYGQPFSKPQIYRHWGLLIVFVRSCLQGPVPYIRTAVSLWFWLKFFIKTTATNIFLTLFDFFLAAAYTKAAGAGVAQTTAHQCFMTMPCTDTTKQP